MNPTALSLAAGTILPRGLCFDSQFSGALGDLAAVPLPHTQSPTDTKSPGTQPTVLPGPEGVALPALNTVGKLALDIDVAARRRLYDFLELSYRGSLEYKHGLDSRGYRILIEHENEIAPFGTGPDGTAPDLKNRPDSDATKSGRYARRLRVAVYENHVAPIIEKLIGYVTRTPPKRSEAVEARMQQLRLQEKMIECLRSAMILTQYFVGWDAARQVFTPDQNVTAAMAQAADPVNGLQPYLVSIDPRRVLDVDFDMDGNVVRFCYEEEVRAKPSLIDKAVTSYRYKEWTPKYWVVYEPVKEDSENAAAAAATPQKTGGRFVPTNDLKVKVVDAGFHSFGRVPFVSLDPRFPTETVCDLNRAMFNLTSLLYEELYNNTFTQFYILGARASDVKAAERGTGNALVIESATAKVGTFGAVDGQAAEIRESINTVREQLYAVAAMSESSTKNVAESAEKKKRDMEGLYTMLLSIVRELEAVENDILVGMGLATYDNEESLTRYPSKFDVASVEDLLAEIEALKDVPYAPSSLKRSLAKQIASKMDPFGPDHSADVDAAFELTPTLASAVVDLITAGALTPELVVTALGIPEDKAADVIAQLEEHNAKALEPPPPPFGGSPPDGPPADPSAPDGPDPTSGPDAGGEALSSVDAPPVPLRKK